LERLSAAGRVRVTRGLGALQIASWAWVACFPDVRDHRPTAASSRAGSFRKSRPASSPPT